MRDGVPNLQKIKSDQADARALLWLHRPPMPIVAVVVNIHVPALIAEVERLRTQVADLQEGKVERETWERRNHD